MKISNAVSFGKCCGSTLYDSTKSICCIDKIISNIAYAACCGAQVNTIFKHIKTIYQKFSFIKLKLRLMIQQHQIVVAVIFFRFHKFQ